MVKIWLQCKPLRRNRIRQEGGTNGWEVGHSLGDVLYINTAQCVDGV